MPLRLRPEVGRAAEEAAHDAAALWGLPDFVFAPGRRTVGSGTRELGDGVLTAGDLGVVLQVKRRAAPTDDGAKERRWLVKQAAKALSQSRGTVRQLCREPASLTNLRGRTIQIDGNQFRWVEAIVLDHDSPPDGVVPMDGAELGDAVVLLRRDWEFLFDQLKSTHAVARYLERVAGEPLELGLEPVRYYDLAASDAAATPSGLDPAFREMGGLEVSEPQLPQAPAASEDEMSHRLVRSILEDIAVTRQRSATEDQRLRVLAELDRLPVRQRAMIGGFLQESFAKASQHNDEGVVWYLRRVLGGLGMTQLAFGVCSHFSEDIQGAFSAWLQLRHHEFMQRIAGKPGDPMSVGVLLTPRNDGHRPWDTTMVFIAGRLELTSEEIDAFVEVWKTEQDAIAPAAA